MIFIGVSRCKYNALSAELRCSVNPCGPCEGCQDFEQVRERLIGKSIAQISRQDILAHNLKIKIFEFWAVVRYPMRMLQVICGLTIIGLLISNKYPISKEHFLGLFKSSSRMVGYTLHLLRMYDVVTEFNFYGRRRTNFSKFLRMFEPLAWLVIFDAIVYLIMKSPVN